MPARTYPRYRIAGRRFKPDQTGTIDFIRSPRPRSFFRLRRDGEEPAEALHQSGWVPWMWDPKWNALLFLRIPAHVDLTRVSFVYHSMRLHATHMVAVPMQDFQEMAKSHASHGKQIVWLYNVGRCGSTLLSHAISDATPSTGLSETAYHLQVLRLRNKLNDAERIGYLRHMTNWYAHLFGPTEATGSLVIKIPHPCTVQHNLIDASIPNARSMFMYREATKVVASSHRVSGSIHGKTRWAFRTPLIRALAAGVAVLLGRLFRPWYQTVDQGLQGARANQLVRRNGFVAALTLMWVTDVNAYLAMRKTRDVPAVRYEDLTPDHFPHILEQLQLGTVNREAVRSVMGRDSQAGTALSRKRRGIPLDERDLRTVQRLIREHSNIGSADAVLPGTIQS